LHGFAKRLLTEWSQPGHLGTPSPEVNPIDTVRVVYVQDEQPSRRADTMAAALRSGSVPGSG